MLRYILGFLLIGSIAVAAGGLQNSDFASPGDITGAGGTVSQLLNTSKIYDNVNAQVLNTTLSAKITNPMTTAEDLIKGGASGAPTRLAVGSNGQCLVVSGGAVGWGACGTSSPLTTKGDLYTYDTGNARLPVGTNGQVLSANSAQATGLEWITLSSGGDFSSNTATSVDGEIVLFSGTGGKTGKRATQTGVCKVTSGVLSASNVDLTSEVTGVLPLANGGSNKNLTAANGGIVYSDADSFEILAAGSSGQLLQSNGASAPSWVTIGGGESTTKAINQTGHGLSVGDVIRYNGTAYVEADASADATGEVYGIVSAVADANNFTVTTHGFISGLSGLTAGAAHFLSETAGALTATAPTSTNTVNKPVLLADSTTSGYVMIQRGYVNTSSGGGSSNICHFRVNMASGSPVETSDPTSCVASYADNGTGQFTATFTTAYTSSTSFNCSATESSAGTDRDSNIDSRTASTITIDGLVSSTGSATDDFEVDVLCTGN